MGDRVATRRNAPLQTTTGAAVRNRQIWTVSEVGADGSLVVADDERGAVRLPAAYAARHVELGWAVTGYGTQGVTTECGIAVVEPSSTRNAIYVAMTRGRGRNVAWILDRTGLADPEEALASAIARPSNALTAHATAARLGSEPLEVAPETPSPAVEEDHVQRIARRLEQLAKQRRPSRRLAR